MPVAQKVKPKHPYIASLKSHCGGSPIIAGTKFPVRSVVFYVHHRSNSSPRIKLSVSTRLDDAYKACGVTLRPFANLYPLLPRYLIQMYARTACALATSLFLPLPVIESLLIPISAAMRSNGVQAQNPCMRTLAHSLVCPDSGRCYHALVQLTPENDRIRIMKKPRLQAKIANSGFSILEENAECRSTTY